MAHRYPIVFFLFLFSATLLAQTASPIGRWKTLNEDTGEARSIIRIYERDGQLFGDIAEILGKGADAGAKCTKCEGPDRNRPILGLTIIRNLSRDGDEWNGGTVFDPEKGASYRLSIWLEPDAPNVLYVRGKHWTGLYRTQQWVRE